MRILKTLFFPAFNGRWLICAVLMLWWLMQCSLAAGFQLDAGLAVNKPVRSFKELKRHNIVPQTMDFSCGPASLATLLSYYFQDRVTEKEIIKYLLLTTDLKKVKAKKGFSLLDLKTFAKRRGYKVIGYKMDFEYLLDLKRPVLIPIQIKDYSHFVIFRGMRADRVFIADPALGNMTMRVEKFLALWGGVGMVVSKTGERVKNAPLNLTQEEEAVFADPALVRKMFGVDTIGRIYADGEF